MRRWQDNSLPTHPPWPPLRETHTHTHTLAIHWEMRLHHEVDMHGENCSHDRRVRHKRVLGFVHHLYHGDGFLGDTGVTCPLCRVLSREKVIGQLAHPCTLPAPDRAETTISSQLSDTDSVSTALREDHTAPHVK